MMRKRVRMIKGNRLLVVLVLCCTSFCFAQFAGGDGTEQDPYIISNHQHLNNIKITDDQGAYLYYDSFFRQEANINLTEDMFEEDGVYYNDSEGWIPIGCSNNRFTGVYDGNGYSIDGIFINRPEADEQGLFGHTHGAHLENIALSNASVTGNRNVGGLVGHAESGSIKKSYVTGDVVGYRAVGVFAGRLTDMVVETSFSTGSATADTYVLSEVGGFAGQGAGNTRITNCYSTASATGRYRVAAFIGRNFGDAVIHCYAVGKVYSTDDLISDEIGALMAYGSVGIIVNGFWDINTTGYDFSAGGGEGKTTSEMIQAETFDDWDEDIWLIREEETYPFLYWQEEPSEHNYPLNLPPVNLFAAAGDGSIILSWSEPFTGEPQNYLIYRDGDYLQAVDGDTHQFSDNNVDNETVYRYFVKAGYDDDTFSNPSNTVEVAPVAGSYTGGSGTPEEPYQISNLNDLDNVRFNLNAHYIQTADINMDAIDDWTPIGRRQSPRGDGTFTGSFDGNGYTISNLTIDSTEDDRGLFGYIGVEYKSAFLANIILDNVNIISEGENIGGLTGAAKGPGTSIVNCHVYGEISAGYTGWGSVGGLVGWSLTGIHNSSTGGSVVNTGEGRYAGGLVGLSQLRSDDKMIKNCFSTSDVFGGEQVGGLIGRQRGILKNSYARGNVTGTDSSIGGLVGETSGSFISYCYSTGEVNGPERVGGLIGRHFGQETDCYWDEERSGIDVSAAGEPRMTRQMTYQYDELTYIDWDFAEIWAHDPTGQINDGYPVLYYQTIRLCSPEISIEIDVTGEIDMIVITWDRVEDAQSYFVYASDDPYDDDWELVTIIEDNRYSEPIEDRIRRHYYVKSSTYVP